MRYLFTYVLIIACLGTLGQIPNFPVNPCNPHDPECDDQKIPEFPGIGELQNNQKHGLWHEFYMGVPYGKGEYKNGKKEGPWTFYIIRDGKAKSDKQGTLKDFEKAKLFSTTYFKNGRLNGSYTLNYNNTSIAEKGNYRNDTLVGIFERFSENGQLSWKSNYDTCYYDSLWTLGGDSYLLSRLPMTQQYIYTSKNNYFVFSGFSNGNFYLIYDKKFKSLRRLGTNLYSDWVNNGQKSEGIYTHYFDGKVSEKYSITNGIRKNLPK